MPPICTLHASEGGRPLSTIAQPAVVAIAQPAVVVLQLGYGNNSQTCADCSTQSQAVTTKRDVSLSIGVASRAAMRYILGPTLTQTRQTFLGNEFPHPALVGGHKVV